MAFPEQRVNEIRDLARSLGLDFFETIFEVVPFDIMTEIAAYGLPTRARHWSYGKVYNRERIHGQMGLSKIYEIVLNNDPAYAFLLDTNSEVTNLLVAAHVYAHVDFFKNNIYFADTNRNMVNEAVEHAIRIDEYIERYGLEPVERIMDIGFAVDRHIDYHKGLNRKPYPQRRVVEKVRKVKEYEDVFGDEEFVVSREVLGDKMPPHPEKDVLWFLASYAPIEPWERDVLEIIRKESFYFYPQFETKVINEGWACVTGDTRIVTDHGLIPIRELVETRAHVRVFDGKDYRQVTDWYTPGKRKVYRIRTGRGYELCGSDTHRILTRNGQDTQWKAIRDIAPGDRLVLAVGDAVWPSELQSITWLPAYRVTLDEAAELANVSLSTMIRHAQGRHLSPDATALGTRDRVLAQYRDGLAQFAEQIQKPQKTMRVPKLLDEDLAAFLGYLTGDGNVRGDGKGIGFTCGDRELVERFAHLAMSLFGLEATVRWDDTSKNGRWRVEVYSVELVRFLQWLGYERGVAARSKTIPELVLRSPASVVAAFLAAYFDCDGCVSRDGKNVILITASEKMSRQVQEVLLHFGVLCSRARQKDECYRLTICGKSVATFEQYVGFFLKRKVELLRHVIDSHRWFLEQRHEDEVIEVVEGEEEVFDLTVDETHRYVAGGFINHNSYWHAETINNYSFTPEEMFEFGVLHSDVVNPGSRMGVNPYYLGYKILVDVEKRWDALYKEGKSKINGKQKLLEIRMLENDVSFLRNYLTQELAEKLELFTYGYACDHYPHSKRLCPKCGEIAIKSRKFEDVIETLIASKFNYGMPRILVREVGNDGTLYLEQDRADHRGLDMKFAQKTIDYVYQLWKRPVHLVGRNEQMKEVTIRSS